MDAVEVLIVGAGPAGLRAAQVLAAAGSDVLVAEKHEEIGPKTCAGGLTRKSVDLLRPLGLPDAAGLERVGQVAFPMAAAAVLHPERPLGAHPAPRGDLGRYQLGLGPGRRQWTCVPATAGGRTRSPPPGPRG